MSRFEVPVTNELILRASGGKLEREMSIDRQVSTHPKKRVTYFHRQNVTFFVS